jgi:hypothetical protein
MSDEENKTSASNEASNINDAAHNNGGKSGKRKRGRSRKGKKSGRSVKPTIHRDPVLQDVEASFAACGRCCFFLAGYRSEFGQDNLVAAVQQNGDSGWLSLTWNQHTRNLMNKSYGVRIDIDFYRYEGCCVACQRQFAYEEAETEAETAVFRIQL